ncbi:hypothetical protein F4779DRAFT_574584 [Xylariaceae sp. FL0662B]|nr:hypothetical protein F4779DRAFT_574584 [Xylariaceae sp. FL0662B]
MDFSHYDTPIRAKVRGITQINKEKNLGITNKEIFEFCGVSNKSGYEILNPRRTEAIPYKLQVQATPGCLDPDSRTIHNDPRIQENRGKKRKFTDNDKEIVKHHLHQNP